MEVAMRAWKILVLFDKANHRLHALVACTCGISDFEGHGLRKSWHVQPCPLQIRLVYTMGHEYLVAVAQQRMQLETNRWSC